MGRAIESATAAASAATAVAQGRKVTSAKVLCLSRYRVARLRRPTQKHASSGPRKLREIKADSVAFRAKEMKQARPLEQEAAVAERRLTHARPKRLPRPTE